jgi:hypothetical protein
LINEAKIIISTYHIVRSTATVFVVRMPQPFGALSLSF